VTAGVEGEIQEFTLVALADNNVTSAALLAIVLLVHGEVQRLYVSMQAAFQMKFKLHQTEKARERPVISITKTFVAKRQVSSSDVEYSRSLTFPPSLRLGFWFMSMGWVCPNL